MQKLSLPEYPFRVVNAEQRKEIFDAIRKKYVALTPEEWVRQHIIQFLIEERGFPSSLMKVETSLKYNTMPRRVDVLAHGKDGRPLLIVECKAPGVKLTGPVFEQIARYNMVLKVKYLLVTNGINSYCCSINHEEQSYQFMENIPDYNSLN